MRLSIELKGVAPKKAALAAASRNIRARWAKTVYEVGARAVVIAKRDYRSATDTTATATAVRTGRLRALVTHVVKRAANAVELVMGYLSGQSGGALKYARIQEYGGVITPKNRSLLAIPLAAAKTSAGVPRGGPRSFPNTFVAKSKAGNLLIFQKTGKDGITPLFVLKDRVTIPARPSLLPAFEQVFPGMRDALTRDVHEAAA